MQLVLTPLLDYLKIRDTTVSSRLVQVFVLVQDFGETQIHITEDGGNEQAEDRAAFLAQNLTEIPPRSERPFGPTSSTVSPLLVRDRKSRRLRASMTA
jgi:hypothetical protein